MRILIAPDKFKDALTAPQAARAIAKGISMASTDIETVLLPLADGGEGTAELLTSLAGGSMLTAQVLNPLQKRISCSWGYSAPTKTAFIELAEASGLRLLPFHLRNPMETSTFGTGELIKIALDKGIQHLLIGLGGSATNDGGAGMAAALGYRFLDSRGREIKRPTGKDLRFIRHIESQNIHPALVNPDIKIRAACDVTNPLTGPKGATYTFGKQKGGSDKTLPELEKGLENLAKIIENDLGLSIKDEPGSGAAGGAGAGVITFLHGKLCSGADLVLEYTQFHDKIKEADLLITGEGKMDASSLEGKLIGKLCSIARKASVPIVAFVGTSDLTSSQIKENYISDVKEISLQEKDLATALARTEKNLEKAVYHYIRSFRR